MYTIKKEKNAIAIENGKGAMSVGFAMGSIWFATHAGGGFATGNQEVNYYTKFGWTVLFIPLLAMLLIGWAHRNGLTIAKDAKAYNYKDFAKALYSPYDKIFVPIFEICFIANALIAVSASIAGAGALLTKTLGVSYGVAVISVGIILLLLTMWGSEVVSKALRYKAYFLIVTLIILVVLGLQAGAGKFTHFIATGESFGTGFGAALWSACLYVGFQAFAIAAYVSTSQHVKSTKACNYFAIFGVLLNGFFLVAVCIMLLGFAPEILKETLPVYFVTTKLGIPWLQVLYSIILFVALMGTCISFIFTTVARFENSFGTKSEGTLSNIKVRRAIISVLTMIFCTGASTVGLTALVTKGYGFMGYFGLFFVVLPEIIVGTIKIRKAAELRKEQGITE